MVIFYITCWQLVNDYDHGGHDYGNGGCNYGHGERDNHFYNGCGCGCECGCGCDCGCGCGCDLVLKQNMKIYYLSNTKYYYIIKLNKVIVVNNKGGQINTNNELH